MVPPVGKCALFVVEPTMRNPWIPLCASLFLVTGCTPTQIIREEPATQQVADSPFTQPRSGLQQTRVNYAPASEETSYRVELIRGKLIGENPQTALRPNVIAIGAGEPEIFHVGLS